MHAPKRQNATTPVNRFPRAWAEIDPTAWEANFRTLARFASPATVLAVVKADAYGLGAVPAVRALRRAGAEWFAVAALSEALELTAAGVPPERIVLLGPPVPEEIPDLAAAGITAAVSDFETARQISRSAQAQGRAAAVQVLLDTGMGRLGLFPEGAAEEIRRIQRLPGIHIEGLFSHFPDAGAGDAFAREQIRRFRTVLERVQALGIHCPWRHMANSEALVALPETRTRPFNMVRPGLALHGACAPALSVPGSRPALTVKTRLVGVRRLPAGATVGYGRTYTVPGAGEAIGTVAIGYADGYPRALSNSGTMLVRGRPCPIVGRVCMDYTMISLRNAPGARCGDEVVVLGRQQDREITVNELAEAAGTIPYELLCRFGARLRRFYRPAARPDSDPGAANSAAPAPQKNETRRHPESPEPAPRTLAPRELKQLRRDSQ